jgi:hypothetical protein
MHTYSFEDLNEVIILIETSLSDLVKKDLHLLHTQAGELTLNHRLAIYLEQNLPDRLKGFNVDTEYMRDIQNENNRKQHEGGNIFPDIIIHHRGNNFPTNYLHIESKRFNIDQDDVNRITAYLGDHYYYKFGCHLRYFEDAHFFKYSLFYMPEVVVHQERMFRKF